MPSLQKILIFRANLINSSSLIVLFRIALTGRLLQVTSLSIEHCTLNIEYLIHNVQVRYFTPVDAAS